MEEELISLETAMLAKEKGFDIPTQKAYINGSVFVNFEESFGEREFYFDADDFYNNWNRKGWFFDKKGSGCFGCSLDNIKWFEAYAAPTQGLLQKWIREEHKLIISINIMSDLSYYSLLINIDEDKLNLSNQSKNRGFITYEEALEDGLFEALKLIKSA